MPALGPQEGPPMKRTTLRWLGTLLAVPVLALAACGDASDPEPAGDGGDDAPEQTEDAPDGETYSIGVTQIVSHPSLDAALDGFQAALSDAGLDVEYDEQNADRKSTRLNSSHVAISYAVFCLKKK